MCIREYALPHPPHKTQKDNESNPTSETTIPEGGIESGTGGPLGLVLRVNRVYGKGEGWREGVTK